MTVVMLGIDLGKNSCSLAGLDESGAVVLRRRLRREGVSDFVGRLPACIAAMEASCGALQPDTTSSPATSSPPSRSPAP